MQRNIQTFAENLKLRPTAIIIIMKMLSDAYRIYHLRNLQHTRQSKNRIGR